MKKKLSYFPSWKGIIGYLLDPSSKKLPKILLVLAVIYLFFPFDLIPDFAVIIGWLDDLGLNLFAFWYVLKTAKTYEERSLIQEKP